MQRSSLTGLTGGLAAVALLIGAAGLLWHHLSGSSSCRAGASLAVSGVSWFNGDRPEGGRHHGGHTAFSRSTLPHPCLFGGISGSRQGDMPGQGLMVPLRKSGSVGILRGGWGLREDARPSFGMIRPHLLLCRLRN